MSIIKAFIRAGEKETYPRPNAVGWWTSERDESSQRREIGKTTQCAERTDPSRTSGVCQAARKTGVLFPVGREFSDFT